MIVSLLYSTVQSCTDLFIVFHRRITSNKLTGNTNTAVGYNAGLLLQGAANANTFLGTGAGDILTTGEQNTVIGKAADTDDATATNQTGPSNVERAF